MNELGRNGLKVAHVVNMFLRKQKGYKVSDEISKKDGEEILKGFYAKKYKRTKKEG
jgi:hypothetical protein